MRLIRNKIYRAFPELDRFTDKQCERFVRSANSSWVRRLGRWIVVGVTGFALLILVMAGFAAVQQVMDAKLQRLGLVGVLIGIVGFSIATGVALTSGLVLRDWILRRRVRQLIARCGACPLCHYSLLGMRVSENLTIVCPECGRSLAVDPAMEELATDEMGAPVYRPTVARDDAATLAERRKRHRKFLKWTAFGAASFVLMLGVAYGVWWWWLVEQAKTAIAERRTRQTITGLREAMWTRGPEVGSEQEFCRLVELLNAVKARQSGREKMPEYSSPDGKFIGFTAEVLEPNFDVAAFEKRSGAGTCEPTRKYVLDILRACREDGVFDQLREILDMKAPIRELDTDWKSPFFGVMLPDLGLARSMARVNSARMVLALHAGDRRGYVEALEENLATAQILERQGLLIEQLVGYAIRALVINKIMEQHERYPDAAWTRDVLDAVVRRSESPGMWRSMEIEKIGAMDAVQCFFAQPRQVQKAQLGMGVADTFGGGGTAGGWCGGYEGNKRALNGYCDEWIAALRKEPWKRTTVPTMTRTGYVVVDQLIPSVSRAAGSEVMMMRERNFCVTTLAVDRHRQETGRYPTSVHQLRPYVAKPELLIDPGCGLPYQFGFVQETGQDTPMFQVMVGDDDRPAKPEQPAPKLAPAGTKSAPAKKK